MNQGVRFAPGDHINLPFSRLSSLLQDDGHFPEVANRLAFEIRIGKSKTEAGNQPTDSSDPKSPTS
jgi:hypothetical protein